jgi:hypothetical protein
MTELFAVSLHGNQVQFKRRMKLNRLLNVVWDVSELTFTVIKK